MGTDAKEQYLSDTAKDIETPWRLVLHDDAVHTIDEVVDMITQVRYSNSALDFRFRNSFVVCSVYPRFRLPGHSTLRCRCTPKELPLSREIIRK
jgi:hypothetical protein